MIGKRTFSDYIINFVVYGFIIFLTVVILYPFFNALAISFNSADDTIRGGIGLWPRVPTTASYRQILTNPRILNAYWISIARTSVGVVTALFCTSVIAFGLSHKKLVGRRFYSLFCLIPMYFSGGIIPYFLMLRSMGLFNTFTVFWFPSLIGLFNIILMRTYFQGIPEALEESAQLDGANYFTVFFRIIIPISTPIIATISLFIGVMHWNDWFVGTFFITADNLKPMQNILLNIVNESAFAERMAALTGGSGGAAAAAAIGAMGRARPTNVRSITMATMFVTIVPVLLVYPFLQRYFVKGIMVGSIKG
jgi:putative aldouronate transport system permease protein